MSTENDIVGSNLTANTTIGNGAASVTIGSNDAPITIGSGNDTITAGNHDTIAVGNGVNNITIGSDDVLTVGSGQNTIVAGDRDKITTGNGVVTITAGTNNTITVGNGQDNITTGPNSVVVTGNGVDVVHVGANSIVTMGSGPDIVHAGTSDTLNFNPKSSLETADYDGLTPNFTVPGSQVNVSEEQSVSIPITILPPSLGNETITGFKPVNGLIGFDTGDFANASQVLANAAQVGANVVITQPGGGGKVTLTNTSLSSLSAANFAFFTGTDVVNISGVPTDATLSAGTNNGGGNWTLTPAQLSGLTLNAGEPTPVDTITVTMTNPAGQGATSSQSFPLQVHAIPPTVGVSVLPYESGDPVTETRLQVSSAVDSSDGGNDYINNIQLSNVPTGVTLSSPGNTVTSLGGGNFSISTTGNPASFNPEVDVFAPAGQTTNFSLGITANSSEPNGLAADETASTSQPIDVKYTTANQSADFQSSGQSIWTTGEAFNKSFDQFIGVSFSTHGQTTVGITTISVSQEFDGAVSLKAGFQADLNVNSGEFNGQLPFNITLGNTYNEINKALEVDPKDSQAGGGSFTTNFPSGSFELDLILQAFAKAHTSGILGSNHVTVGPFNFGTTLISKNSSTLTGKFSLPDGIGNATFAWPNLTTVGNNPSPGTVTSSGASNPIFTLSLDPIAIILDAIIGNDPLKGSLFGGLINYTLLAATVAPAIDVAQTFNLNASLPTGVINPDGGSSQSFNFGSSIIIPNSDGQYSLTLDPNTTLENDTSLAGQLTLGIKALAASLNLGVTSPSFTLFNPKTVLGPANLFTLYNNTFPVQFQSTTLPKVTAT